MMTIPYDTLRAALRRTWPALALAAALPAAAQTPGNPFNYARSTAFEYNGLGQLSAQVLEPDYPQQCQRTEYSYDSWGNQTNATTKNCAGASGDAVFSQHVNAASYAATSANAGGFFATTTSNALGQSGSAQFDARFGLVTQGTDVNGMSSQAQYDALGRKVLQINGDGQRTRWDYAYCSSAVGSPYAACSSSTPHPLAFRVTVTPQDASGNQNGPQSINYVDVLGRTVRTETQRAFDSQWIYTETWFNPQGTVKKTSEPALVGQAAAYFTSYFYDSLNRVVRIEKDDAAASGGKAVSTQAYNANLRTSTNPLGQVERKEFDAAGLLARSTDAQGGQMAYLYDAFGNLLKTVDAMGNARTVSWDYRGRKVATNDLDSGAVSFVYDALGQVVRRIDAKGQTTTLQYDALGRKIAQQQPTQNDYWSYDKYADGSACTKGIGLLCETWSGNGYRRKMVYENSKGYPVQVITTMDTVMTSSLTYDGNGHIASQTFPSGVQVNYGYNSLGAQTSTVLAATGQLLWQPLSYNARGQLLSFKYGNNVQTTQSFAADTGRATLVQAGAGNGVLNQQYGWNAGNNLTSRNDVLLGVTETYGYDGLNRLVTHNLSGPNNLSRSNAFAYNALGNILTQTEAGAYKYPAAGSARPHAVSEIAGFAGLLRNPHYTYDANGNLTQVTADGGSSSHTWTSFDAPAMLSTNGATASFLYSSDHNRIKETLTRNVGGTTRTRTIYQLHPDGAGGLAFEREVKEDGSVEMRHFVNGSLVLVSAGAAPAQVSAIRYWHKDSLGSIVAITNEGGSVVERLAYDPFGKRRNLNGSYDGGNLVRAASTDRGFTGHEMLDSLGLVHMNARIYDPAIGRFFSPDPMNQMPTDQQSYNRYAYILNNPLNATDPTGMFSWGGLLKVVAIAAVTYFTAGAATGAYAGAIAAETGAAYGTAAYATAYATAASSLTGAVVGGVAGGFVSGLVASEGDLKAALNGAALGGLTAGMASQAGSIYRSAGVAAGLAAHGVVGCVNAELSGGNCGTGALAGIITKGTTILSDSLPATVIAGALTSKITGQDPTSGAVLAGLQYLYNNNKGLLDTEDPCRSPVAQLRDWAAAHQPTNRSQLEPGAGWGTYAEISATATVGPFQGNALLSDSTNETLPTLQPPRAGAVPKLRGFGSSVAAVVDAEYQFHKVPTGVQRQNYELDLGFGLGIQVNAQVAEGTLTRLRVGGGAVDGFTVIMFSGDGTKTYDTSFNGKTGNVGRILGYRTGTNNMLDPATWKKD